MLMKSMGRYVHKRLTTSSGKEAYRIAMQQCINHVSSGLESLDMIKARVEGVREEVIHQYKKTFFNSRREEYKAWNLAVDQAMEIVNCLEARFIVGQQDAEPRIYRGSKWFLYEDENLFK